MAGLCAPLPTLHRRPRGRRRTARGRCGSLLLHRSGLAPPTPCRSPGALSITADQLTLRSDIKLTDSPLRNFVTTLFLDDSQESAFTFNPPVCSINFCHSLLLSLSFLLIFTQSIFCIL